MNQQLNIALIGIGLCAAGVGLMKMIELVQGASGAVILILGFAYIASWIGRIIGVAMLIYAIWGNE